MHSKSIRDELFLQFRPFKQSAGLIAGTNTTQCTILDDCVANRRRQCFHYSMALVDTGRSDVVLDLPLSFLCKLR